eukprot:CAMPEP_0170455582 /NCGR_PEP_ID=MMETSP0123-20130129/3501_1 /TAXON_ID=182087 /ORGANISM="Favella ehrenbergii, Strain Fehren 1" /LENGTH=55 /DNA_ID=CAMNT_0010718773 /DNA_START=112 /DNA_END=279 /DNA_ORIENTATION=-
MRIEDKKRPADGQDGIESARIHVGKAQSDSSSDSQNEPVSDSDHEPEVESDEGAE